MNVFDMPFSKVYENIDGLLMERHMAKVARRKSKNHLRGPSKRTEEDDRRFEESFRKLIENNRDLNVAAQKPL